MRGKRLWMLAIMAMLLGWHTASAQIVYEFANSAGVAQTSFEVPLNETVPIKVFIHELTAGAPTLNSQGGLGTGAVRVRFDTPPNIAAVQTVGDITVAPPPWAFGTGTIGTGANLNSATIANASNFGAGVLPDSQGRVELGTLLFRGLTLGSVSLTAVDPNAAAYDNSSFNTTAGVPNINYDPLLVAGMATLTVVPEPTSLILAGAAFTGFIYRVRRRPRAA